VNPESEEYGVSSFAIEVARPFNPERLKKLLDENFVLNITNIDQTTGQGAHEMEIGHGQVVDDGYAAS